MQILPINSNSNKTTFNGKFSQQGKWPNNIKSALLKYERIQDLTSNYDIVARLSTKKAGFNDQFHERGKKLYKIKFSFLEEGSKLDKILDFLHLKRRYSLTRNYHSEYGTEACINDKHFDYLLRQANLSK